MNTGLTDFFKALGDETRQRIINLLLHHSSLNVNDLTRILEIPQSKISRHLALLRHADWLIFTRRDKWVYYRINPELDPHFLDSIRLLFKDYLRFTADLKKAQNEL